MRYKKVGIEDAFSYKPAEKTKKIILFEYIFYSLISFFLAIYYTLNLFSICHNLAKKNNFKISGLVKGYSFLGGYRDFSDFQWRYYRQNLSVLMIFATIFVFTNKLIKIFGSLNLLKLSYLIFGLGYGFFLHRIKMIYLIIILYISFELTRKYNLFGKKIFISLTWIFCIIIKITSEIYDGYSINIFNFLNLSDFIKNPLLGWNSTFGLVMLKIISYNMEFVNVAEKEFENNKLISMDKVKEHCKECNKGKFCLRALKFVNIKESDFSFLNLLIYIFYPPFYFSGPTIMYHSFIFQLNNYKENNHNKFFFTKKIFYLFRCIIIFLIFEIFNHFLYVNAIMTNKNNIWLFEEFRKNNSYFYLSFLAFNNLVFIYLKFSLIWKVARYWGWVDGIYSEENMNRCIYNNYTFEGFWRQWHRSYNIWLIRYMYIPLGGRQKKLLNTFIIFSFVALWHDLRLNLLLWAWGIYICLIPEIIIKSFFAREDKQYLNDKMWFRYLRAWIYSIVIMLMITANLIGFGIGNTELVDSLLSIWKETTFMRFIQMSIFYAPFTFCMFFIRDLEKKNGIENNF